MWRLLSCRFFAVCLLLFNQTVYSGKQIVRIGAIYPITNIATARTNFIGAQWLAGSLMGLKDLNDAYESRDIEFQLSVRDSRKSFSNTVVGCLSLARTVYHGNGSQVIVGAGFNAVTQAMAYVFSDPQNDLAQIAYASNISSLSHNDVFPDFLRTYPSSSYEGHALAHTIKVCILTYIYMYKYVCI
jgi:hypothetical protein